MQRRISGLDNLSNAAADCDVVGSPCHACEFCTASCLHVPVPGATSGDTAPQTDFQKGLSWQVAGETEVKAQIKMRLKASGVPIVVIRSFQLVQKKSALQFKALDQVWPVKTKCRECLADDLPNGGSVRAGSCPLQHIVQIC